MADIRQIKVGAHRIGIAGLDEVFERVRSQEFASEEELTRTLVDLVAARNYVPETGREDYGRALLRAFKIDQGESVEEEPCEAPSGAVEVRVYGPGCANCERLAANAISALAELGIDADFEHVRDIDDIVAIGPVGLPALAINGKIVAAGRVPSRENIVELLKEATE